MAATPPSATPSRQQPRLGTIQANAAYPLPVFSRLTGMKATALRSARRAGLRVCDAGGRRWIIGSDWLAYLDRINPPAAPPGSPTPANVSQSAATPHPI